VDSKFESTFLGKEEIAKNTLPGKWYFLLLIILIVLGLTTNQVNYTAAFCARQI
jgi:hypothetical protein